MNKKLTIILIILTSTVCLVFFQNCNPNMSFNNSSNTSSQNLDSNNNSTFTFSKSIEPFQPLDSEFEITLLIDDSKSNAENASNIIQGVQSIFEKLAQQSTKTFSILAFSMSAKGSRSTAYTTIRDATGRMDYNTSDPSKYLRISEYLLGMPITSIKINSLQAPEVNQQLVTKALSDIQNHLNQRAFQESPDSIPSPYCDIVARLSENRKSPTRKNSAFILITDENSYAPSIECVKHWDILYQKGGGGTPFVIVPAEKKVNAEGGGFVYVAENVQIHSISSCSNTSGISNYLSSRDYRTTATTFSNCQVYLNSEGADRQIGVTYYTWLEEPFQSDGKNDFADPINQIKRILSSANQGPFFVGLFAILNNGDIQNQDQEIATHIMNWLITILPEGQRQFNSLTQPNYASFIDQVLRFKLNAETNQVNLEELIKQVPIEKQFYIKEVFFKPSLSEDEIKIQSFSFQGNTLLVNDNNISLSNGGEIKVIYGW